MTDEWILTAAHCVDKIDAIDIFLGAHNVREVSEVGIFHMKYQKKTIDNN